MSDPGYFGSDGCDERDYSEEIPDAEGYRKEFRDGSAIIIIDMEDPVVESKHRTSTAGKAYDHIIAESLDTEQSIKFVNNLEP